jgi:hypothetical protein
MQLSTRSIKKIQYLVHETELFTYMNGRRLAEYRFGTHSSAQIATVVRSLANTEYTVSQSLNSLADEGVKCNLCLAAQ